MKIKLHNLILFTAGIIRHRISPWLWLKAWRKVVEGHRQEVHKMVWELKKQGKVREDRNGRLWWIEED